MQCYTHSLHLSRCVCLTSFQAFCWYIMCVQGVWGTLAQGWHAGKQTECVWWLPGSRRIPRGEQVHSTQQVRLLIFLSLKIICKYILYHLCWTFSPIGEAVIIVATLTLLPLSLMDEAVIKLLLFSLTYPLSLFQPEMSRSSLSILCLKGTRRTTSEAVFANYWCCYFTFTSPFLNKKIADLKIRFTKYQIFNEYMNDLLNKNVFLVIFVTSIISLVSIFCLK